MAAVVRLVTSNPGKLREAAQLLGRHGIEVRWLRRTLPEPQADDLETVVRAKLEAVRGLPGWVLVEDSGLFVDALGGFPGVYSAYVLRTLGPSGLGRLVPRGGAPASFRAVAGLRRGRRVWLLTGTSRGRVVPHPRGREGFGFDPVFVPSGSRRTFAEMSREEKNALSHRARALDRVGRLIRRSGARERPTR